jgi:hypothetical protein
LRRVEREEGGGKAEGVVGFIGAALVDNQGVGNARGSYSGDVTGRGEGEVVMEVMTGGSHLSAREERRLGYRFGFCWNGPRAPFFSGPNRFPGVQNVFFLFGLLLFSFSFLDFYLSFEKVLQIRFEGNQG